MNAEFRQAALSETDRYRYSGSGSVSGKRVYQALGITIRS